MFNKLKSVVKLQGQKKNITTQVNRTIHNINKIFSTIKPEMFIPAIMKDNFFGKLKYDFKYSTYETEKEIAPGMKVYLLIEILFRNIKPLFRIRKQECFKFKTPSDVVAWVKKNKWMKKNKDACKDVCEKNIKKYLKMARKIFLWLQNNEKKLRKAAADELLETYNDEWNEGKPISKKDFIDTIKITGMNIDHDGEFEVWYEDGGLFADHQISIRIRKNKKIYDITLEG